LPSGQGRKEPWLDPQAVLALDEEDPTPVMPKTSEAEVATTTPARRQEPKQERVASSDEPVMTPLPKDLPNLLVQISLVARGAYLEGENILAAMEAHKLKSSKLQVFHRVDGGNQVVYTLASMVEPGTFPMEKMADFATPGITLFMQLPGPLEAMAAFQDMLATAQALAEDLNAELQDQGHNLLRPQAIEHLRSEIQEHSRQLKLAQVRQQQARR
jgi:cell division protein ZipA